jgi:hypothetical protein
MEPSDPMMRWKYAWLLILALPAAAEAADCRALTLRKGARPFTVGETLVYELSSLGVRIGTLTTGVEGPRNGNKGGYTFRVKADTSTFVSTFKKIKARAEAEVAKDLKAALYEEESSEDGVLRALKTKFPPRGGRIGVAMTLQGEPGAYELDAAADARDLVSAVYTLRALDLKMGQEFCSQVFGQYRLWKVTGKVAAKERILTPAGEFDTLRIDGLAVRMDDPRVKREIHLWLSDDARRLPVGGFGQAHGKPVQALLSAASLGDGKR